MLHGKQLCRVVYIMYVVRVYINDSFLSDSAAVVLWITRTSSFRWCVLRRQPRRRLRGRRVPRNHCRVPHTWCSTGTRVSSTWATTRPPSRAWHAESTFALIVFYLYWRSVCWMILDAILITCITLSFNLSATYYVAILRRQQRHRMSGPYAARDKPERLLRVIFRRAEARWRCHLWAVPAQRSAESEARHLARSANSRTLALNFLLMIYVVTIARFVNWNVSIILYFIALL